MPLAQLSDRLQMLAFEAELAHLPRPLISAIWQAFDSVGRLYSHSKMPNKDLELS
jgi:hypothetical protein